MKTNKRLLLGVCAGLLVGAAALTTASALAPKHPHSDLLLANAEALASNEGSGGYKNARKQYCAIPEGKEGCIDSPLRNCSASVFCIR